MERKQQSRSQSRDFLPEMGMEAYQPVSEVVEKTYQHQQFLDEIIGGVGKAEKKGVAIIGEPGAGKTTLLEQIGKYLQQQQALPIFIPLTNLGEMSLKEYLLTQWRERKITHPQLEELLQTQRVWFLLDGVDEMAQASPLDTVYRQAVELQQARVVLSCRLNVWDASTKNLPNFQTFKTLEFSEEQVQAFIHQWFGEEQLWERLKESGKERLRDLVKNPLRLSLLCQTWEYEKELPETQAALYERFVRYFYDWKPQEFPVTLTQQQELNAALARLALEAIDKGKTRFRIGQRFALKVMREEWLNLSRNLGWLNQVDRDKDTEEPFYAFYHPTFQEYFAALGVENWSFFLTHVPEDPQQGIYRIFEPQWKQVILLWLGRWDIESEKKEAFIQTLVEFDDKCIGFYWYQARFLAIMGFAEFKGFCQASKIIDSMIDIGFGFFDKKSNRWITFLDCLRKSTKQSLLKSENKFVVSSLLKRFNAHEEKWFKQQILEFLLYSSQVCQEIIDIVNHELYNYQTSNQVEIDELLPDRNNYQLNMAIFLIKLDPNNQAAISVLIDSIRKLKGYGLILAVNSLERVQILNERILEALLEKLPVCFYDVDVYISELIADVAIENKNIILKIENLLNSKIENRMRVLLLYILSKIDITRKHFFIKNIIGILENGASDLLIYEIIGKVAYNNPKVIQILTNKIQTSDNNCEKYWIANSLGKINSSHSLTIDALINLLDCQDEDVILEVIESLGEFGFKQYQAIQSLKKITNKTSDPYRRRLAAYSLARISPDQCDQDTAVEILIDELKSERDLFRHFDVSQQLQQVLKKDFLSKVISNLRNCNTQPAYQVLWHCAQNLSYPDFYQAWHHPTLIPHPELQETTGVGATPEALLLNWDNFPQNLARALREQPELADKISVTCIDASQFLNPDNPASEIYVKLVKAGYPRCADGTPRDLQSLKVYCELECPEACLIFYEAPSNPSPQGFSPIFLNALSRFSPANRIAIVSEKPDSSVQTFSPTHPNLIPNLIAWMRGTVLED
ncbi:MAG: NACHT domain-containing protein [Desertifilum sp.]|nr:NACHT domain-containing protein [Desertifilum sp.]